MTRENEGSAWIGTDITLIRDLTLQPTQVGVAHVQCEPGSFPSEITEEEEDRFAPSIRSRFAQLGLHPATELTKTFALDAYFSAEDDTKPFNFVVPLTNLSEAPIRLDSNTKLLRFFISPEKFINNGELRELVVNKDVEIDGKENVDWKYVRDPQSEREDEVGIALRIKEENRKYLPFRPEAVTISGKEKKYREKLDSILQPVSKRRSPKMPCLWIGETSPLRFDPAIAAEIRRGTFTTIEANMPVGEEGEHIDSRLVDTSGWPIRVEIFSSTEGEHWAVFQFFRQ